MMTRLYIPVYAATLLLSAFLLFAVQPMFSKMILPLLGGTPQVWNTAMLFFQCMLLAGYAYAHGTSRILGIRMQALVHIVLLIVFLFVLPVAIPDGWHPPEGEDPTLWQLSLMVLSVGGPFFVLSGSAPMLQHWFADTDHADSDNPYFLYGASNLGSMSALLAYPFVIEPLWPLAQQSGIWTEGYIALIVFTVASAALVWLKQGKRAQTQPKRQNQKERDEHPLTWKIRLHWLVLAFIPSSLMLGVTTFITTDIASGPLLWIIPLALYVGTFILVFARRPLISRENANTLFGAMMITTLVVMICLPLEKLLIMGLHYILFFTAALCCHTELAALRPKANRLTEFYLFMSIGGALGGVFNALIAPRVFIIPLEYALVLAAACFMRYTSSSPRTEKLNLKTPKHRVFVLAMVLCALFFALAFWVDYMPLRKVFALFAALPLAFVMDARKLFALGALAGLIFFPPGHIWGKNYFKDIIHQDRNFFGVLKVIDTNDDQRILLHGTTNHGSQPLLPGYELEKTSYYSTASPLNDVFLYLDQQRDQQHIAVLGLGIGVTACWSKPRRDFTFFEIDPDVVSIAENPAYFTYLSKCGSPYEIQLGDARLKMQNEPDQKYDLIIADAFSSDNIPMHLVTIEAAELYLSKLKPAGILAFNISNNFLDLEPVLAEISRKLDISAYASFSDGGTLEESELKYVPAHFLAMTRNKAVIRHMEASGWTQAMTRSGVRPWSDQFSNIVSVLGNKTGKKRFLNYMEKKDAEND